MLKQCKRNKAYYTAHRADATHHKSIRNAHSGVRKTPSELRAIADIIEPLIAKGQSLNHICATHLDELGISERTLYNYIDQGVFKVRNIDLPKKVVYRQRRPKKVLTKLEYQYGQGRTYEDFKSFMEANPYLPVVEMDTVKGGRNKGKVFLTLDNKTPFDLMDSKDGKKLLSLLQLSPIPPDEVTLSPKLLKR